MRRGGRGTAPSIAHRIAAAVVALALGAPATAAAQASSEADADSLAALLDGLDPGETVEALAAIEDVADARGTAPGAAGAAWRLVAAVTAGRTKLDLRREGDDWAFVLRRRGADSPAGGARVARGGLAVTAGSLSLRQGHGLLVAGAGRWAGLASPGSTAPSFGAAAYAGAPERRSHRGVAVVAACAGAEAAWWSGRADDAPVSGAAVGYSSRRGSASAATVRRGDSDGASLAAGLEARGLRLDAETCAWRPAAAASPRIARAATLRWRGRAGGAWLQAAAADPGFAPAGGQHPSALASRDGVGWVVGVRWRASGLAAALAAGEARRQETGAEGLDRTATRRWSLEIGADASDGLAWGVRRTQREDAETGWRDRMPWLPAAPQGARRSERTSAWIARDAGARSFRATWRHLRAVREDAGAVASDDRSLFALQFDADCAFGCRLRIREAWAWGGGADLVGVASPAPAFPRPRHWGAWSGETSLGVQVRRGAARVAAAFAVRRPQASDAPPAFEAHLRIDLSLHRF